MSTRQKILEAVYQSIGEKGFGATNINEVVQQIGLTKGAFYYYFKDGKDEVGLAVIDELILPRYLKRWEKITSSKTNPLRFLVDQLKRDIKKMETEEQIPPEPFFQLLREYAYRDHPFGERLQFILGNLHESITVGLRKGIKNKQVKSKIKARQESWQILSSLQGAYLSASISQDYKVLVRVLKSQIRIIESLAA
ncbi:MAG: TetR/AcrR family transcriptional regulator [Bacteroidota bacterium]